MKKLSIDIGGTYIKAAFVEDFHILDKRNYETPKNFVDFKDLVINIIKQYKSEDVFDQIAIAVPGTVTTDGLVRHGGAIPYLDQVNLKNLLATIDETPVTIENDAKSATLGEMTAGNLHGVNNGAVIVLGTGVGMGICLNGNLYKGTHNKAGEISFMVMDGEINSGESFAGIGLSAVKLIQKLAKILNVACDGPIVFDELTRSENGEAFSVFKKYCFEVAKLCFNLQTVLDVEKIVISGGISQQAILIENIQLAYKSIREFSPIIEKTVSSLKIEPAYFKSNSNLIGATEVRL